MQKYAKVSTVLFRLQEQYLLKQEVDPPCQLQLSLVAQPLSIATFLICLAIQFGWKQHLTRHLLSRTCLVISRAPIPNPKNDSIWNPSNMVFLNAVYHESSWISPTFRCFPWSQRLHVGVVDELLRVGHGELHQPHGREDAAERRRHAQTHAQTNAHGHAKADTWRFPDVKGVWVMSCLFMFPWL